MIEGPPEGSFERASSDDTKKTRKRGEALIAAVKPESKNPEPPKPRGHFLPMFENASQPSRPEQQPPAKPEVPPEVLQRLHAESNASDDEEAAPLDGIGEQELPVVRESIVKTERAAAEHEQAVAQDPEAQAQAEAAARLYALMEEDGHELDEAEQQVYEELGVDPVELSADAEPALDPDYNEEAVVFDRAVEAEDDDQHTLTVPAAGGGGGSAGSGGTRAGGGGAAGFGSGGSGHGSGGGFGAGGGAGPFWGGATFSRPSSATHNQQPVASPEDQRRPNASGAALVGGIVGYLIGRRRGRIKTEKKLLPIQNKLEKQVEDMHWQLKEAEQRVRLAAVQKVHTSEKQPEASMPLQAESVVERPRTKAPEARQLHAAQSTEQLGHILVAAEMSQQTPTKLTPEKATRNTELEHKVPTMNRAELLELSESIVIEGSSLRRVYENNLIGEHALRRIVIEHLRGGDTQRALRQEIVEREIDFERDPAMRDIGPTGAPQQAATAPGTALDHMVQRAAEQVSGDDQTLTYVSNTGSQSSSDSDANTGLTLLDTVFLCIISGLLIVALIVYFTR